MDGDKKPEVEYDGEDSKKWLEEAGFDSSIFSVESDGSLSLRMTDGVKERMGLPRRLWNVKPSDFDDNTRERISKYVDQWDNPLNILNGSVPNGPLIYGRDIDACEKVMAAILKAIRKRKYQVYCIAVPLLKDFIDGNQVMDDDRGPLEYLQEVRCLGIKGIGTLPTNDFGLTETNLTKILQYRYDNLLPTVFVSSLHPDDIQNQFRDPLRFLLLNCGIEFPVV